MPWLVSHCNTVLWLVSSTWHNFPTKLQLYPSELRIREIEKQREKRGEQWANYFAVRSLMLAPPVQQVWDFTLITCHHFRVRKIRHTFGFWLNFSPLILALIIIFSMLHYDRASKSTSWPWPAPGGEARRYIKERQKQTMITLLLVDAVATVFIKSEL